MGSNKFIEKLSKSKSTGIIATHDVSLCELEKEFSAIKIIILMQKLARTNCILTIL